MKQSLSRSDLDSFFGRLKKTNQDFKERYPGLRLERQPVHTVYGGAHLYKPGIASRLGNMALTHFHQYAPTFADLAKALDFPGAKDLPARTAELDSFVKLLEKDPEEVSVTHPQAWLAWKIHTGVKRKLELDAVEDQRVDFEDGYGARPDEEEDGHAVTAAEAMAKGIEAGDLPGTTGIRIKSFTDETKSRSLRTLDLFLTRLCEVSASKLPVNFVITLPKVTTAEQVAVLADCLSLLEQKNGLDNGVIRIELMIETVQTLFDENGSTLIPRLVKAGNGRVSAAILGTYDYTASANVASSWQDHKHSSADFARQMMQAALVGTSVSISDGITNIMPIAPHRGGENVLNQTALLENIEAVHTAWKIHFDNIMHSLKLGFYQGWDLHPAQFIPRYAAVYYFFLTDLKKAGARLKSFVDQAAQASRVGTVFDDAASAQGLINFFASGLGCGALSEQDVLETGITLEELAGRSFQKIVENRT